MVLYLHDIHHIYIPCARPQLAALCKAFKDIDICIDIMEYETIISAIQTELGKSASKFASFLKFKGYHTINSNLVELYESVLSDPEFFYDLKKDWVKQSTRTNTACTVKNAFNAPIFTTLFDAEQYQLIKNALDDYYTHVKNITDAQFAQLHPVVVHTPIPIQPPPPHMEIDVIGDEEPNIVDDLPNINELPPNINDILEEDLDDEAADIILMPPEPKQKQAANMNRSFSNNIEANLLMMCIRAIFDTASDKDKTWIRNTINIAFNFAENK